MSRLAENKCASGLLSGFPQEELLVLARGVFWKSYYCGPIISPIISHINYIRRVGNTIDTDHGWLALCLGRTL
jgi:hypothetical protein